MANKTKGDELGLIYELLRLDSKAYEVLNGSIGSVVKTANEEIKSPIEQVMFFVLLFNVVIGINREINATSGVYLQKEITVDDKKYYADFVVETKGIVNTKEIIHRTIIECDGHDFHEKTKEQAQHDKERDRLLQKAGYTILHFTGSEIWADPQKCGQQIYDIIINSIKGSDDNA